MNKERIMQSEKTEKFKELSHALYCKAILNSHLSKKPRSSLTQYALNCINKEIEYLKLSIKDINIKLTQLPEAKE